MHCLYISFNNFLTVSGVVLLYFFGINKGFYNLLRGQAFKSHHISRNARKSGVVTYLTAVLLSEAVESARGVEDEVTDRRRGDDEEGDGDKKHRIVTHPGAVLLPDLYRYSNRNALIQQLDQLHPAEVANHYRNDSCAWNIREQIMKT